MRGMVWFRRDLRVNDQSALYHAVERCEQVIAVYVFCQQDLDEYSISQRQQDFIILNLAELSSSLARLKIPLLLRTVKKRTQIAPTLKKLCTERKIQTLFYNREYEVNELQRDQAVDAMLEKHSIGLEKFHDQVLFEPGTVLTGKGDFYTVFTPFSKRVWQLLDQTPAFVLPKPKLKLKAVRVKSGDLQPYLSKAESSLPAGETAAKRLLKKFIERKIHAYQAQRDFPAVDGTSGISPYLAIGVLSPRQCMLHALENGLSKSARVWVNEILWREFYKHVVVGFPRVCRNEPFQLKYKHIPWLNNEKQFVAWCKGETGIAIVDAAMHQLNETGWMHNRCRMIVAMFLSKNLLIDWRWGEQYFASQLVDYDFSANNGGWQWSASTGTDAAPYFRIMNPDSQAAKFDPDGKYLARYLSGLTPDPIVDLKATRARAIEVFKAM